LTEEIVERPMISQKLSQDFSREFRKRFGHSEFEQLEFTSNRFVETTEFGRLVPVNEYIDKQKKFGQYIGKEFTEYQVDNYLKSSANTRTIYDVKEALSNVEVATKSGYKFKIKYKIASNRVIMKMQKPNQKIQNEVEMNFKGEDARIRLAYLATKTVRLETDYTVDDEITSLRAIKSLNPKLSTSITGQSFNKDVDAETPKQERILLGLTWND
jgi:hypothetical protein